MVGSGSLVDIQVFFCNTIGVKGDLLSLQEILKIQGAGGYATDIIKFMGVDEVYTLLMLEGSPIVVLEIL